MTNRRLVLLVATALSGAVVWYLFRPELLIVDRRASEVLPASAESAIVVASGRFVSDAHETVGLAALHRDPDGHTLLRLTGFSTSNGPDVHVYLVAADTIEGRATVKRSAILDLGSLKGNLGEQNYEIPMGTDLTRYRSVSIWCKRFAVNFGAAVLD